MRILDISTYCRETRTAIWPEVSHGTACRSCKLLDSEQLTFACLADNAGCQNHHGLPFSWSCLCLNCNPGPNKMPQAASPCQCSSLSWRSVSCTAINFWAPEGAQQVEQV